MDAPMESILNRDLLAHNTCFGCGLENDGGLRIEVSRDSATADTLKARFTPSAGMAGFPGVTHGGAIFTALDCLSTWTASLLGPNRQAAWVLRSANTTYHNPAPVGEPLALAGRVRLQAGPWDPVVVVADARRPDGTLCVEAEFKVVPLSADRLKAVAGIEELPLNWQAFLADED